MNGFQLQNSKLIVNNSASNAKSKRSLKSKDQQHGWLHQINIWLIRNRHRQELMKMPDYLLEDIGLTRKQVVAESKIPFWRAGIF